LELVLTASAPAVQRGPFGVRGWLSIIAGAIVGLVGVALLVLPGPGTPLVLAGLALLAPYWPWAHRMLGKLRTTVNAARMAVRSRQSVRSSRN
jgi:drug/metabolite transporter (DMT)-like permease